MAFTQDFFTQRRNFSDGNVRIGELDRIWYDSITNTLRIGDGSTPGGIIVGGQEVAENPFNQNLNTFNDVTFANVTVTGTLFADMGGNIDLGNLYIIDETIYGKITNRDITLSPAAAGNVRIRANLVPDDAHYTLGTSDNPWEQAYVGPHSLTILPQAPGTIPIVLENLQDILGVTGGGFAVYNPGQTYYAFQIDTADGKAFFKTPQPPVGDAVINISANPSANVIPLRSTLIGGTIHITGANTGPTLFTLDNFDNDNPFSNGDAVVFRRFRGNVDVPAPVQAGDRLGSIAAAGYGQVAGPYDTAGLPGTAQNSIIFRATENHTITAQGAEIELTAVPNGSIVAANVAFISASGTKPGVQLQPGMGIEFADGTYQTTAAVTQINLGVGFGNTGPQLGPTVGLDTTDVHSVISDSYTLLAQNTSQNITLHLTQELSPNSSPTFSNLTVGNITVNGTLTTVTNASIFGKILYLANNSTMSSQIDGGGIILGNVQQDYYKSILYSGGSNNWWDTDGSGFKTQKLYSEDADITGNLTVTGRAYFGTAAGSYEYPNAALEVLDNVNSYAQVVIQNLSPGTQATADFVATADNGTDTTYYIDLGMSGVSYDNSNPNNSLGTSLYPNDGYLYVQGNLATTPGGNLTIGTSTPGTVTRFISGGINDANVTATASATGWTFANITATRLNAPTQYLTESANHLFYTDARARAALSVTRGSAVTGGNLTYNSSTGVFTFNPVDLSSYSNTSTITGWISSNVSTLNTSITNANIGMKGYVDSQISTVTTNWTANALAQETEIQSLFANAISQQTQINNLTANVIAGNLQFTPNTLNSTTHIALQRSGNVVNLVTDATTSNIANTIVVRDQYGTINVNSWTIQTALVSTNYTVTATDYWIGTTAKNLTITLPGTAPQGRMYIIADCNGNGNPLITISASSPVTVHGGELTQQGQSRHCVYVNGTWYCN